MIDTSLGIVEILDEESEAQDGRVQESTFHRIRLFRKEPDVHFHEGSLQ